MGTKLFVGSIHPGVTEDELAELFGTCGQIVSCDLMLDKQTGRSRGFAFIELATEEAARKASRALDGKQMEGVSISVKEARPRESRGPRRPRH